MRSGGGGRQREGGGGELATTLADMGAGRLLADRVQVLLAHQLLEALEVGPMAERHFQPVWPMANDRRRCLRRKRLGSPRGTPLDLNQHLVERQLHRFELSFYRAQEFQPARALEP